MHRALLAATIACSLVLAGCFPHNKQHRHIAFGVELGVLGAGITVLSLAKPGADCARGDDSCRSRADLMSGLGVVLLLAGLGGLVATISSAEAEAQPPPRAIDLTPEAEQVPDEPPAEAAKPARPAPPEPAPPPVPTPPPAPDGTAPGG